MSCCISGSDHVLLESCGLAHSAGKDIKSSELNGLWELGRVLRKIQTMEAWLVKFHKEADSTEAAHVMVSGQLVLRNRL